MIDGINQGLKLKDLVNKSEEIYDVNILKKQIVALRAIIENKDNEIKNLQAIIELQKKQTQILWEKMSESESEKIKKRAASNKNRAKRNNNSFTPHSNNSSIKLRFDDLGYRESADFGHARRKNLERENAIKKQREKKNSMKGIKKISRKYRARKRRVE